MGYKKQAKSIRITDQEAIVLTNKRAVKENRTSANAAAVTLIENLRGKYGDQPNKDTRRDNTRQEKN